MKIVLIIYAVSWLILLLFILVCKIAKKSTLEDSWKTYGLMFAIAPIVVLLMPFILFSSSKSERKAKKCSEELEAKEKADKSAMDAALRSFESAKPLYTQENRYDNFELFETGRRFFNIMVDEKYDLLFQTCLDSVNLPEGYKLFVAKCKPFGTDDECRLMVLLPDGKVSDRIFDYIFVEPNCMGVWQAYLLYSAWHCLPLFGHANYSARKYIFSNDDYKLLKQGCSRLGEVLNPLDHMPEIRQNGSSFYVSCPYWSDFGGFIREYVEYIIEDNKVKSINELYSDVLYQYDSSVRF